MTLVLPAGEMEVLEKIAGDMDTSKVAVMRTALRLYQLINDRQKRGDTISFIDADGKASGKVILWLG